MTGKHQCHPGSTAYLNIDHLRDYVASHGVDTEPIGVQKHAIPEDHRLRTNYVSCGHGAGACNIEPAPGWTVEDLIMEISAAIRSASRRAGRTSFQGNDQRRMNIKREPVIQPPPPLAVADAMINTHGQAESAVSYQRLAGQQRGHGTAETVGDGPQQLGFVDGDFLVSADACGAGRQHPALQSGRDPDQHIQYQAQ